MSESEKKSIRLIFEDVRAITTQGGNQQIAVNQETKKPHVYNTKNVQDYKDLIWYLARQQVGRQRKPVLNGAIEIRELKFEFYTPNKLLHNKPYIAKPDWVNVTKLLEDVLEINDLIFENDKQIARVNNLSMIWSDRDCITIELREI